MLQSTPGLPLAVRAPHFEVSSTGSLYAMLDAGLGISVLPALAAHLAPFDRLAFQELAEPQLEREICVITRHGRALSPAAQSLLAMIGQHLQSYALPRGARSVGAVAG